jgi:sugar phosphate isomerase/epimerase
VHPSISLNLLCLADTPLSQALDFCASAGFQQVGVPFARFMADGVDVTVDLVRKSGFGVSTIGCGALFTLDDPSRWTAEAQSLNTALDIAASLGAKTVYGHAGPAGQLEWDDAAAALTEAVAEVVSKSRRVAVPLIIEPTNPLYADIDFVHTFRDAADLAAMTGLGLCLDLFHIWDERGLLQTAERALSAIHMVQLGDFSPGTRLIPGRVVPGDGVMPLHRILGRLLDIGFQGPIDLELLGPRIREEGVTSAAVRSGRYMSDLLNAVAPQA